MKNKFSKSCTLCFICLLCSIKTIGQQRTLNTHYTFNVLNENPAYTGTREVMSIVSLSRAQWLSFSGAPLNQQVAVHSPVSIKIPVSLGLSLSYDKIGPLSQQSVSFNSSYKLKISEKFKLSFGLRSELIKFSENISDYEYENENDPELAQVINSISSVNFGFGLFGYSDNFYIGASLPEVLRSNDIITRERHLYFLTGKVFQLKNSKNQFKTAVLAKLANGARTQVDINLTYFIDNKFWIGGMFRTNDAVGTLIGANVNQQLSLGYSYDLSIFGKNRTNPGSQELMLRYEFIYTDKRTFASPRYF